MPARDQVTRRREERRAEKVKARLVVESEQRQREMGQVHHVARDYVQRALHGFSARLRALDERLARNGFWTVFALRLVLGLAPLLNWGLGLTGVRLRHYVAGTALGVVPNITIAVIFADAIVNRLAGGGALSGRVALGVVLIVAVIGAAIIARRFLGREEAAPPARGSHEPKAP